MNIADGIIRNNDLFMKSPLIRLRGEGEVNLPTYQIAYKLKPEIVGTLKGQGGKDDAAGVTVPLKISGNLNAPLYSIDAKAALMENLTPQKIGAMKDNVKALKEQYKEGGGLEGLKGLLGR
jgi:AsmA protein